MDDMEALQQRFDELEQELESFAYSAAHDLHAPLRAILHFSRLFKRKMGNKLAPEEADLLEQIPQFAEQAQALLDALLDYSRLGRSDWQPQFCDMQTIAQHAVAHSKQAKSRCCDIQLGDNLPTVYGDDLLLRDLLVELLDNALLFNDQDRAKVSIGYNPELQAYSVRDNGLGIRESAQERIFSIFTRLHRAGSYGDGLGIGLARARKIVRLHRGRIWLQSSEGEGSCFYFSLGLKP